MKPEKNRIKEATGAPDPAGRQGATLERMALAADPSFWALAAQYLAGEDAAKKETPGPGPQPQHTAE